MINDSSAVEINNSVNKVSSHKILLFFIIISFVLEVGALFYSGAALSANEWGSLGMSIVYIFYLVPSAIISVILSIIGMMRFRFGIMRTLCFFILLISLIIPVIAYPGWSFMSRSFFSHLYSPIRAIQRESSEEAKQEGKVNHYQYFKNELSSERMVTNVSCGGVITLDNQIKVTLNLGQGSMATDDFWKIEAQIEEKMKEKLIGKKIKIIMPAQKDFLSKYSFAVNGCYYYTVGLWPKQSGVTLGEIRVDAKINDELIDLKWLGLVNSK